MKKHRILFALTALFALMLSACGKPLDIAPILPPEPSQTFTHVSSTKATFLPSPSQTLSPSPSPTATATPEPVTFKVGPNDDMFSVALYFGVSLDALKTANPEVIPNAMGVGTELLIPITPSPFVPTSTATLTPKGEAEETPAEAVLSEEFPTYCYRDAMKAVYCFSVVHNNTDKPLENVTLLVTLKDETGKSDQHTASTLINVIPSQSSLAAASYFPPEWGETLEVRAELDFQLPYGEGEERYLDSKVQNQNIEFLYDGKAAKISGEVVFTNPNKEYMSLNVLAIAWGEHDEILGMRRWSQWNGGKTATAQAFDFNVYSMGGAIARVDVYAETLAYPIEPSPESQIP